MQFDAPGHSSVASHACVIVNIAVCQRHFSGDEQTSGAANRMVLVDTAIGEICSTARSYVNSRGHIVSSGNVVTVDGAVVQAHSSPVVDPEARCALVRITVGDVEPTQLHGRAILHVDDTRVHAWCPLCIKNHRPRLCCLDDHTSTRLKAKRGLVARSGAIKLVHARREHKM